MANISSAYGKLTLNGNWTEEAVEALRPVLDAWEFYGEYGMRIYEYPTVDKTTIEFNGCGRWSFSGTLSDFDSWTRAWIKDQPERNGKPIAPLSQEQYDLLLELMCDNDLSIEVEFEDVEEGCGSDVMETGEFTSDGESLCYETLSCENVVHTWKDMGSGALNAAVDFFCDLLDDPDEKKVKKWVKKNVEPTTLFEDVDDIQDIFDLVEENGEFITPDNALSFGCAFSPDTEEWEEFLDVMEEIFGPVDDYYIDDDSEFDDEEYDEFDEFDDEDEEDDDDGDINDWDDEPQYPVDEIDSLDFSGKAFVLTGEFQNCDGDRDAVQQLIVDRGGRCTGSVSGKTNYLVLGDFGEVGAKKVEKALEQREKGKDIKIIIESDLFRFM